MTGVNKAIVIGHLGAAPDVRRTQSGAPVVSFNVATGEAWRDKATGERRERTDWHRIVIFAEPLCKLAEDYLRKGSKVYLEGKMQTRKWQGDDGKDRYTTEVVLTGFNARLVLLDKREGVPPADEGDFGQQAPGPTAQPNGDDDDIPF